MTVRRLIRASTTLLLLVLLGAASGTRLIEDARLLHGESCSPAGCPPAGTRLQAGAVAVASVASATRLAFERIDQSRRHGARWPSGPTLDSAYDDERAQEQHTRLRTAAAAAVGHEPAARTASHGLHSISVRGPPSRS